jgi:3-methyladenine DNA glycosylase AlkD
VAKLRLIAKEIGKDHALGLELWNSGIHDARILAVLISDPLQVTDEQMEHWVYDFDSWDVCDLCCLHLFDRAPKVYTKVRLWMKADEEFVKRAGFALMAVLAVHDKEAKDTLFESFLKLIERSSKDERNYVKKAVNWALRQIGKRNLQLHVKALESAYRIKEQPSKSARWIAIDAIRELESQPVRERLQKKSKNH